MNIILLESSDYIAANKVRLSGRRAQHILNILRASEGSTLRVGEINGFCGIGEINSMQGDTVDIDVVLDQQAPMASNVSLLMALPRPKILRRVLRMVAELGVKDIVLLNTWRVEKSYWQSPLLAAEKIEECFTLGLEQAGDTRMPTLRLEKRFKPFVEDELASWQRSRIGLLGHPAAAQTLDKHMRNTLQNRECILAIGPEGGFIPYEIEALAAAGFQVFKLGNRPMRVDTALPYLLGALHHDTQI